jgi:hypothetical protein
MSSSVLFESIPRARTPVMNKRNSKARPKVASDRVYYPCVPRVRPTSQWCLEEPDLEHGRGHDDYDIGEGQFYPIPLRRI